MKAQLYMASLIPIRLVDTTGKPNFLRSSPKSTVRDDKTDEEGGEDMWNILSKNENLRTEFGTYIPASQRILFGTTQLHTHTRTFFLSHTHTLTHTHTHAHIHTHTHSHTRTRSHTYIHTNRHAHTYIHTH